MQHVVGIIFLSLLSLVSGSFASFAHEVGELCSNNIPSGKLVVVTTIACLKG